MQNTTATGKMQSNLQCTDEPPTDIKYQSNS